MIQIIGSGGFGREVASYCNRLCIPVFQFKDHSQEGINRDRDAVIAIGNEETRRQIVDEKDWQAWGVLNLCNSYGKISLGEGTIVCPHTILTTDVTVGRHCLININCTIGHDVVISDFVTINPGVNVSGSVRIGANCNIGSNAVIRNGISICDDVIIGAGTVVVKNITEPGIYIGNPAVRMDLRVKPVTEGEVKKLISLSIEELKSLRNK